MQVLTCLLWASTFAAVRWASFSAGVWRQGAEWHWGPAVPRQVKVSGGGLGEGTFL